ncbi:helix-turn-helix transcriptional regulator [Dysosmobacter sp.]|uniref:helix-turn-helix transcriptional regulator n=1 Tax=Dysosmobacter sp. TaxID=2591382 RepID=UPI002A7CBC58|nr:helix-turn-helix domain-containing protein [Dysosmobacter sp.]MDY3020437.1 helix-turn-helix domain-containing protein [Oscillospiraceae bacterium]MDY5613372.1 helix-turn-helix domain-containing protein [Dysosmobacter sp.]
MHDYSRSLGVAVIKARKELGLTQVKLAEMTGIDSRTIIKIEGCEGNPMLENLYPLIRTLKIDPWEVFYPELKQRDAAFRQLQLLLIGCSEEEIKKILPICQAAFSALKSKETIQI